MSKLFYDRYIKLAHIGKGANAHVYKVRHAELGYVRAIKVLNDYIEGKDERIYQSFIKECRTLLTIGNGCHPNIVRIYSPDLIDNHAIVEMDYVQGITLDTYIKEHRFIDYKEVIRFIHDIVGALAYTHHDIYRFLMSPEKDNLTPDPADGRRYLIDKAKERELVKTYGISHNDLHSNNIMRRDYDGSFILLDFGLAVQDGKCVKSSHVGDGNPEYMAPEKFDSETASPRSDIYSLGILMYEVLAGRVPFELEYTVNGSVTQQSRNKLLNQHLKATPPAILPLRRAAFEEAVPGKEYERDYPEWLEAIIMKCLAKNPDDRYADAKALLNDINAHLEEAPSTKALEEAKRREKELIEQVSALSKAKSDLEQQLCNAQKEKAAGRSRMNGTPAENLRRMLATPDSSKDTANLEDNIATLSAEVDRLKSENIRLASELEKAKAENSILKADLAKAQTAERKRPTGWVLLFFATLLGLLGSCWANYLQYDEIRYYKRELSESNTEAAVYSVPVNGVEDVAITEWATAEAAPEVEVEAAPAMAK